MHYDPSLQKFEKQTSGFVLFAASVLLPRGFYRGMTNDRKKRTAEKKEKKKKNRAIFLRSDARRQYQYACACLQLCCFRT